MKLFRKSVCLLLCTAVAVISCLCGFVTAAGEEDIYCEMQNGILYIGGDGDLQTDFKNDLSITEVYVERGITSLPDEVFAGCTNLRKITMSNTVEFLGAAAFSGCSSLNEVKLSKNLFIIDENTFSGCTSLTEAVIPDGTTDIKRNAFSGCTSLEFVILRKNVLRISSDVFNGCTSLEKVYYAGSEDGFSSVRKPSGCFGNAEIICLSPEFRVDRTFTPGKAVFSVKLAEGTFSALDAQLSPTGDCEIYRIQMGSGLSSSSNRKTGLVSVASDDEIPVGKEIFKTTFNVADCENYGVAVSFISCTVVAENYEVEVPVIYNGDAVIDGGHTFSEMEVVTMPSADGDGLAEAVCDCCGTVTKELPFIFKNCAVNGDTVKINSYGLGEAGFRDSFLTADFPSVVLSDTSFAGTGTAVTADYSYGIILTYNVALTGDVDGDGFCDAQDSIYMACLCEGMLSESGFSGCELAAADCCEDGAYDYSDVSFAEQNGLI